MNSSDVIGVPSEKAANSNGSARYLDVVGISLFSHHFNDF